MCHYLTYDKNVGLTLYLVCIFIAYAFIYRHLNALGEKRGVRFEVKQEEKKIGLVIVQAISLEEYDR